MLGKKLLLIFGFAVFAMSAAAQAQTPAGNVSAGQFGSTTGGGTYTFSGNVGIGTTAPSAPLNIVTGSVTANNQIYNALTVQALNGTGGYGNNGTSIFLDSVNNFGIQPVAGIWSSLEDGGLTLNEYGGALVLGSTTYGSAVPTERMRINRYGNVGIGTTTPAAPLEVNGSVKLTSGSGGSLTFQDGTTQSTAYTGVTCGGDYAESVDVAGDKKNYEPGDVLVIGAQSGSDVVKSSSPYSTLVVGVYSTKPGVVGRRQSADAKTSATEVPMAMMGIVPTKVNAENGAIERGDLLVSSSSPGYAMKGTDRSRLTGAVIGKALGSLASGAGVIEVVVTLQ